MVEEPFQFHGRDRFKDQTWFDHCHDRPRGGAYQYHRRVLHSCRPTLTTCAAREPTVAHPSQRRLLPTQQPEVSCSVRCEHFLPDQWPAAFQLRFLRHRCRHRQSN
ncbi:hypothetical protein Nepgr_018153 [Nepenthes gracilis]|uniref:Uncharacterized protein n=1 Tax=Nepenthes gracilis TaxID=150966 RepID=A0AAD3SSG4_NEPGR|nr:hypothetical protein Nepgr_018153 [Nepenthes gracilis]